MSNATHTLGPWEVYQDDPIIIINSGGSSLGEMSAGDPFISHGEMMANARLASAAPELLEALEKFAAIEIGSDTVCRVEIVPNGYSDPMLWRQHIEAARAAIAKAKGGAA